MIHAQCVDKHPLENGDRWRKGMNRGALGTQRQTLPIECPGGRQQGTNEEVAGSNQDAPFFHYGLQLNPKHVDSGISPIIIPCKMGVSSV